MSDQNPQHHQSAQELASQIAKRQISGSDARNLIAPCDDEETEDEIMSMKSPSPKKPRNHQSFHRRALREMQRKNQLQTENEKDQKEKEKKNQKARMMRQFGNVRSRVFDSALSSSASSSLSSNSLSLSMQNNARCGSIIAPPRSPSSTSAVAGDFKIAFGRKVPTQQTISGRGSFNVKNVQQSLDGATAGPFRGNSHGRVPDYITKRKTAMAEAEESRRRQQNAESDDDGPPAEGMVRMKESERLETL
eukprot:469072-Ditylum_brightwellii.AAC.1